MAAARATRSHPGLGRTDRAATCRRLRFAGFRGNLNALELAAKDAKLPFVVTIVLVAVNSRRNAWRAASSRRIARAPDPECQEHVRELRISNKASPRPGRGCSLLGSIARKNYTSRRHVECAEAEVLKSIPALFGPESNRSWW